MLALAWLTKKDIMTEFSRLQRSTARVSRRLHVSYVTSEHDLQLTLENVIHLHKKLRQIPMFLFL